MPQDNHMTTLYGYPNLFRYMQISNIVFIIPILRNETITSGSVAPSCSH